MRASSGAAASKRSAASRNARTSANPFASNITWPRCHRLDDARELRGHARRVAHERQDELRHCCPERVVVERQCLAGAKPDVGARDARSTRRHEWLRRIDGGDVPGTEARREHAREAARSAPHLEHRAVGDLRELEKERRELARIAANVSIVPVRSHAEGHASLGACSPERVNNSAAPTERGRGGGLGMSARRGIGAPRDTARARLQQ